MILGFTKWAPLALPLLAGNAAPQPVEDVTTPPTAVSQPQDAPPPSPEQITQTADEVARLLDEGQHERAMVLLQEVDPRAERPALVYMRGVVEEDRGNCPPAIEHYERYIDMGVPDVDAAAARRRRDRCERLLEVARTQLEPKVAPPVAPAPAQAPDEPPPRYADPLAIALTSVGVVGLGVGAGLFGQGRVDESAARDAFDLQTYSERGERAVSLQRAGVVVMAVGGAVLAVGITRFVWVSVARQRAAKNTSARWSPLHFRF